MKTITSYIRKDAEEPYLIITLYNFEEGYFKQLSLRYLAAETKTTAVYSLISESFGIRPVSLLTSCY